MLRDLILLPDEYFVIGRTVRHAEDNPFIGFNLLQNQRNEKILHRPNANVF